jgi:hypothetical protein
MGKASQANPCVVHTYEYILRGLSKKYPTLGRENKVLYLGGYNT